VCLAAGVLLGYLAASGHFWPSGPENTAAAQTLPAVLTTEAAARVPAQQAAEEPIVFEVILPANALLEIDGKKTAETGEQRTFQSPPLKVGGRYTYTLKATLGDKVVTRQMHIAYGAANTIDLRPDFQVGGAVKLTAAALAQKPAESQKPNIL